MLVKDRIYGKFEIDEPVIIELIKSQPVQRLKKISQYGVPDIYYSFKGFSRYEHSVGVMLLLRKLNTSLDEQISGLLHDVSTTAFSHIADWVFAQGRKGVEEFQNINHEIFINNTEIPTILRKYRHPVKKISNYDNFGLLEREIPDLCADRVDYALREFVYWLNPKVVSKSLKSMINYKGEIVFSDPEAAYSFSLNFLELQRKHWGALDPVFRYSKFSEALKIALNNHIINKDDFYKDEKYILTRTQNSGNREIINILELLKNKKMKHPKNGQRVFKKFRHVNPKVLMGGKLVRLSKLNPYFGKLLVKHRKINKKGVLV